MDELDLDFWVRKGSGVDNCLTLDSDLDSDSDSDNIRPARRVYRPMAERAELQELLTEWRLKIRREDPLTVLFPLDDILSMKSITLLARLKADAPETSSAASISEFVDESDDFDELYSTEVYEIISNFNAMTISRRAPKVSRLKRARPEHAYMNVFQAGPSTQKKRKSDGDEKLPERLPLGDLSLNDVSTFNYL